MPHPDAPPKAGTAPPAASAFAPLRHRLFAVLWCATVLGNIGSFMRDVASGWLVTDISNSPAAVAMVQAAGTLPVFLLAIPAGALSDIVDRRKFLIIIQVFLAGVSATLAFLAATGNITVVNLVLLTFLGGAGAALLGPSWQAIVPELVPKNELKGAVALGSLGFNIARALGPAAGGLLLATAGPAATYGVDVVSYLFVIAALWWWKRAPDADDQLRERFGGAVRAGFRYAMASTDLRRILFRTVVFFLFANVAWALMPLVARQVLGGGAGFYGVMLGATGAGAVGGAILMPRVRARLGADGLLLAAALVMAIVLTGLSLAPPQWAGLVMSLFFGAAWIAVLTTLNSTTQAVLPNWVRGRGLAVYLMTFNGAMTASSLIWGAIGEAIGVPYALLAGGICLSVVALFLHRFKLPETEADLTPSHHWPEPAIAEPIPHDRGPVLITIEYKIKPELRDAFISALHRLSHERRRDGAYQWGMSEDAANSGNILEWFFVESWAEHLRQHQRVSRADADVQAEAVRFHTGNEPPKVAHYLAIDRS
ncbi:MAG TPA: MFS transporter [Noviherbaspirillum sp.]|nr:MFS transporter [Noviherbaspirillum sp.]